MHATLARFTALVGLALLLSACARQQVTTLVPTSESSSKISKMQVFFKGDDPTTWPTPIEFHEALLHEDILRKTLGIYGDFPKSLSLHDLITHIRNTNQRESGQVPGLTGLGGVYGHAFLDLAERALRNGEFDTTQQIVVSVFGQITHYEFHKNPKNAMKGNGKLEVITYITWAQVPSGSALSTLQTDAYRWKLRVVDDGFHIVPHSGNATDPFPNTMDFTPEMLARVKVRGYKYKLWAKGKVIKIDLVELKKGTSPSWVTLSETDPMYKSLYAEIDENCIDMMFVHEPPMTLGGLKPPLYCLGRCKSPLIVNTGE